MRVKTEITCKFYFKLTMKVYLLVEFDREKCNLNYKSHIYKSETMIENVYKYPSKSIHKILNYKPVYTSVSFFR